MNPIEQIAQACGGKIENVMVLTDGSGCCTMSMPLPKNHWIYETDKDGFNKAPPTPLRLGVGQCLKINPTREDLGMMIREACKYAVRASTMCGKQMDFDPDAMLSNMVVGLIGYHTEDGLSSDSFDNPPSVTP